MRLIDSEPLLDMLEREENENEDIPNRSDGIRDAIIDIINAPTIDAVPNDAYQRVVWENAVMAEQLNKIGKGFGAEMDDVVPVVHGRLINPNPYGECSECGTLLDIRQEFKYCPMCGARLEGVKMEGAEE